jgi:hypothetical protein
MTKISRTYGALTRFLRSVIENPKTPLKVRMQAAERLDGLYSRHQDYTEKSAAREERKELRALGIYKPIPNNFKKKGEETPEEQTPEELSPEELKANLERAEIDRILNRRA